MKQRTGTLILRNGRWSCRWRMSGRLFSRVLLRPDGQPATEPGEVEAARVKLMTPFALAAEADTLDLLRARVEHIRTASVDLTKAARPVLLVADAWAAFQSSPNRSDPNPRTLKLYQATFARWVAWHLQRFPNITALRDVTPVHADAYAVSLAAIAASPNSYNKHLQTLSCVFRVLSDDGAPNPWQRIRRKQLETESRRELTVAELRAVCGAATGELRVLFAVGVYTGLRLGDCCTLRWAEVDLDRRMIRRVPNKTARRKRAPVSIPIHPSLLAVLAALPRVGEWVSPAYAVDYLRNRTTVVRRVQLHFRACGIATSRAAPSGAKRLLPIVSVGFHSLRHSFASRCRAAGAPLSVVESIVGHSSPAMTQHYTHTSEPAALAAVSLLPALDGPAVEVPTVRSILLGMTARNWRKARQSALALLPA